MRVVYVAGPLRDPDPDRLRRNLARARIACDLLIAAGISPVCPWRDTDPDDVDPVTGALRSRPSMTFEVFMAVDLAQLERCDAVFLLPGWQKSVGACIERGHAERHGIPRFDDFLQLVEWCGAA